ncbi:MAG: CocE/NonD family hydrolase [Spirochaetota bacterium]
MRYVDEFPNAVRVTEQVWIPARDGTRLAARIWLPSLGEPVPALLEFIPYRKRDRTRARDSLAHPYFAGHGYASVRVDLRGSGESEGVLEDEYLEQEQLDALDIMAWLEKQPWCNGTVGMFGISWGGFNALQVASLRPPQLGAIIPVCFTDDRYSDDVHYMGGCLLGDNLSWASTMFSYNSCPPDPAVVPQWKRRWLERMEGSGLWLDPWLRHQHRDAYYKHGSVCEDYDSVEVPMLAVSGWADGYTNGVFRALERFHCPRWGLIGPWGHAYPHIGKPGPPVGFLQECVSFWDRWLKGIRNGYEQTPMLRCFTQEYESPVASYQERTGRWVAFDTWSQQTPDVVRYGLRPGKLLPNSGSVGISDKNSRTQALLSPLTLGQFAGKWCSYATTPDLPGDQREEDGGALVYDSEPLVSPVEIVGRPVAELTVAPSTPEGVVAVRLSDVGPSGEAYRVTYGVLNLAHRLSHESPESLRPGVPVVVRVALNGIAHTFRVGNRIRLAISTSYWPLIWTPLEWGQIELAPERSSLELPIARGRGNSVVFHPPESASPLEVEQQRPFERNWTMHRDLARGTSAVEIIRNDGRRFIPEIDLSIEDASNERYSVEPRDPYSASGEVRWKRAVIRDSLELLTHTHTKLSCTRREFVIDAEIDAQENGRRVFSEHYHRTIPRDHV